MRKTGADMIDSPPTGPVAIEAAAAPLRSKRSNYPEPFASRMEKRRSAPWEICSACGISV